ncbi:hypothetical protein ACFPAF_17495 [Hymenobacter endophyticus]|uniref:Uncharacterized protein n=1 Tax=Hymenobacter endophyticus TaxID=3076335 RepID=A0ABU3TLE8_9BACT|nr:hypothetical protein [Hymenobacter endophyticus]MDU0372201.1 hypothetical protein [Hymenobacter endophyticus]
MQRALLLLPLLALATLGAQAQTVTDATRTGAALDSLMQAANVVRQQALARSYKVETNAPHLGRRNQRTKGFDASYSGNSVWRKKMTTRRNNTIMEVFTVYQEGNKILQERRTNGIIQYLWVRTAPGKSSGSAVSTSEALYLRSGYLHWNGRQYLLPTLSLAAFTR